MGTIKQRYKDSKAKEIIDYETGEVIDISYTGLIERKSTDEISINSKAYVYLDTEQLFTLLANGIKQVELALLISISNNLMIGSNICMINDEKPHTTESIAKLIGTTTQSVKLKLNSLVKIGVIHHGIMKENKRLGKVYIVNPHIIRKGHKMKQSLGTVFDEIKRQR
jgi:predicted transcriptional regulator